MMKHELDSTQGKGKKGKKDKQEKSEAEKFAEKIKHLKEEIAQTQVLTGVQQNHYSLAEQGQIKQIEALQKELESLKELQQAREAYSNAFQQNLSQMIQGQMTFEQMQQNMWEKTRGVLADHLAKMLTNFIEGFLNKMVDAAFNAATSIGKAFLNIGTGGFGGGIGKIFGFAHGGDFIANGPTPIMVGEGTRPERVTVTPLSGGNPTMNNNSTNNISINATIANDMDINSLINKISYALERKQKVQVI